MKRTLLVLVGTICVLAGTVFAQGTHSVTLNWTQSTSTGVTGNKVYRSATAGGPYGLLFTSVNPITTYTDGNLGAAITGYYVVTAVCSSCNPQESAYSNEIKATTPGDKPLPASGLTATVN